MPMLMHVDGKFEYLLYMRLAPKEPDLWMSMDARREAMAGGASRGEHAVGLSP